MGWEGSVGLELTRMLVFFCCAQSIKVSSGEWTEETKPTQVHV